MNRMRKIVALFLTCCMLVLTSGNIMSSYAKSEKDIDEPQNVEQGLLELPAVIDNQEAAEREYIYRAKSEEPDLYTFVFVNRDGSRTLRTFSHPVKYQAEDGNIHDISLDISKHSNGSYSTKDHEITTYFPEKLTEGILLAYKNVNINMSPKLDQKEFKNAEMTDDGRKVEYRLDDITSYVYELTYCGFKEDIVVAKYTGQTDYDFILRTNGLFLKEQYGSFFLVDEAGECQASIGDIIVFTADEKNNALGTLKACTIQEGQEYLMTIQLDPKYLADNKTKYPIRIDPTIEINYSSGVRAIEDVTIVQNSSYPGNYGSLYIGRNASGNLMRALMRFPNLSLRNIPASRIVSASVEIRDLMCQTNENITIDCHIYNNAAPAWSESSTTTWTNVGTSYLGSLQDSHVISHGYGNVYAHRYSFNILEAARAWAKNGSESPAKGLVFKANATFENQTGSAAKYWYKTFAAYNRSEYQPSLSITYIGTMDAENITLNTNININITESGAKRYFSYTPSSTGFYAFESFSITSGDPYAWLYNQDQVELKSHDDTTGADYHNFRLLYHLVAGKTYYFAAGCYGNGTGSYSVRLINTSVTTYGDIESLSWGQEKIISCDVVQQEKTYRFIPSQSGEYIFYSVGGYGDPEVWIYNSGLTLINSDNDTGGNNHFWISVTLSAGQVYYVIAGQSGGNAAFYQMEMLKKGTASYGSYSIQNEMSNKYINIEGPSTQVWVNQGTYSISDSMKWEINLESDGYYTIRSKYGSRYYIGVSDGNVGSNNIRLYSSMSDMTKWKIYDSLGDSIYIEPKGKPGKVLYVSNGQDGTKLQLSYISSGVAGTLWKIFRYSTYQFTVNHYYDYGFSVRYSSISSNAAFLISSCQNKVAEQFLKIFGIEMQAEYSTFVSSADDCKLTKYGSVTANNIDEDCDHYTDHLTTLAIRNGMPNGNDNTTIALWTGHLMTDFIGDRSNSDYYRHSIVMTMYSILANNYISTINWGSVYSEYCDTLMHELSHQLGCRDHYCYNLGSNEGKCINPYCDICVYDRQVRGCLMGDGKNAAGTDTDLYCSDCLLIIREHLANHH